MIPSDAATYNLALSNFEYVSDMNQWRVQDRWTRTYDLQKHFIGDCEDFAFSMQHAIGGEVWYIILPIHQAHAALVRGGHVYDNLHIHPVLLKNYNGVFIGTLNYTHHTITLSGREYKYNAIP